MKQHWTKIRNWIALFVRALRLRIAVATVGSLQVTTVSLPALMEAVRKVAELESFIEKSGEIAHKKAVYGKLLERIRTITSLLDSAARLGDPAMGSEDLQQHWVRARMLSMSHRRQKKIRRQADQEQYRQALTKLQEQKA